MARLGTRGHEARVVGVGGVTTQVNEKHAVSRERFAMRGRRREEEEARTVTYLRSCVPRENPPYDNVATARRALLLLMYRYHVYSGRKGCALKRGIVHSSVYYKKYSGNCRQNGGVPATRTGVERAHGGRRFEH